MSVNYTKLEQWRKLDGDLKRMKEEELALRKELFAEIFDAPQEGANNVELMEGWTLSANYPMTRSLDQTKMADALKALKKAKADPELIKVKYELSVAEYRKADEKVLAVLNDVLTTKPGCPSLKLVPPKGTPA